MRRLSAPPRSSTAKLAALARTWGDLGGASAGALSAEALASAFGDVADPATGYGDASEAYCALQNALDACDGALRALAELGGFVKYAPYPPGPTAPDFESIWHDLREVFSLEDGALVAFDLAWAPLDSASTLQRGTAAFEMRTPCGTGLFLNTSWRARS